jgi:hypothetical protein
VLALHLPTILRTQLAQPPCFTRFFSDRVIPTFVLGVRRRSFGDERLSSALTPGGELARSKGMLADVLGASLRVQSRCRRSELGPVSFA